MRRSRVAQRALESVKVEVVQDSTAAKGTATRIGIGKIKHLDTGWLWIQEVVKAGVVTLEKINGKVNPADLLTKPKSAAEAARLASSLGYELVLRKRRTAEGKEESLTGMVKRMMRGDRRDEREKMETLTWWIDGGARNMVGRRGRGSEGALPYLSK